MRAHLPCQPVFSPGTVRCFLLGLAALLVALPASYGDIQQPPRAHAPGERRVQRKGDGPAIALPVDTQVEQGGTTVIVLRAEGQVGKSIDFLVRTPPQHGSINGEPNRLARNRVSMVYVQTPGDEAEDDEFTYCVQAPGSPLSAPETAHIRILPNPPSLAVSPPELDFGAVKAGDTASAEVTVENRGGTPISGVVLPPSPWTVEGPGEYHLGKGESKTFQIVFRPLDEQVFSDALHFRYETGSGVRLIGTGLADPAQEKANAAKLAAAKTTLPVGGAVDANGSLTVFPVVSASPAPAVPAAVNTDQAARTNQTAAAHPDNENTGAAARPSMPGQDDETSIPLNEAQVTRVEVRKVTSSTVDLAWKAPLPKPASYRVELQYVSVDQNDKVRVDWRPYAQVEFKMGLTDVTAHLYGLPPTGLQMMRVVSVDSTGQLSSPSPTMTVAMDMPPTWWRPTPLKILVGLLLVCCAVAIRRRWEVQQMLREIDEDRRVKNEEAGIGRGY